MITRLDRASARKISAGQVITDLSSVVKELLENALDAGAQSVNIRVHGFGLEKIVVEDDGEGIPMPGVVDPGTATIVQDASSPLLKSRATTKRMHHDNSEDNTKPNTSAHGDSGLEDPSLGFRGEALHSLAQLGKVTIETMHAAQAPHTVRLTYDSSVHETHLSVSNTRQSTGTVVTVEGLFKQLPVRHKEFVKNQRRQLLNATGLVKQYAVSHPQLRLVFTHQENSQSAVTTLVSLTGSNDLQRSVSEAYGGLCLSRMSRVEWHCSFGDVEGFVSHVSGGGRMAADRQIFSLNRRIVDLPRLAASLNDAFAQCLPNAHQRQSVAFFLRITTRGAFDYDVNLAPNKRKVLMGHEEKLAEELHAVALKEFSAASEGIEMDRQTQRSVGGVGGTGRADASREVRMPVSATAFTQFTFRRNDKDGAAAAAGASGDGEDILQPTIDLGKIGTALYNVDGEDAAAEAEADAGDLSMFSLSSSVESNSDSDSDSDGEASGMPLRKRPRASTDLSGGAANTPEHYARDSSGGVTPSQRRGEEEEGEGSVVQLSDQGNQKREGGAQVAVPFPAWEHLAMLRSDGCRCECERDLAVSEVERRDAADRSQAHLPQREGTFSAFLDQTGKELTAYFHKRSFKDMVVLGQFNHGFIIASLGDDLFVIDQHASDEKFNYERLLRAYAARPQPLVQPIAVPMDAEEVELAVTHASDLLRHGFTVKRGDDPTKLLVSSVPVLPYDVVSATDVLELVQQLVRYGTITRQLRAVWHSLATKACRTSIMIGTALPESTMCTIVARLGELDQPWTCPHGRPTLRHLGNMRSFHMGETNPLSPENVQLPL